MNFIFALVPPLIQGESKERTKVIESGRSEIMECRIRKGKPTPEVYFITCSLVFLCICRTTSS